MKSYFSDTEKNNHIKEYLEKNLVKYGGINYGYFMIDKRDFDKIVIISDLPDYFTDIYLKNQHQNIDPIIINALNQVSPLVWDGKLKIHSQWTLSKIFDSVKPHHNIISGQTFILHGPNNNMALLSLYVNKFLEPESYDKITKHKHELQGLLIHVYEMLTHLYNCKKDEENRLINELTFRETEILHLSSTGKTYPEIASMLNITVSTVKFHMAKVIKKLGVKNAKHAIRLCTELNLTPDPTRK